METLLCAGVDEAGRGPLAGSVFAAAVILPEHYDLPGLADSKKLSEKKRDALAAQIKAQAVVWSVAEAGVDEIARLNILHAAMLAMRRAVEALAVPPQHILIDGNRIPDGLPAPAEAVVKGDAKIPAISAASILAKTARDAQMYALAARHPQYGFERHKGYGTPEHRRGFAPVREILAQGRLFGLRRSCAFRRPPT